MTTLFKTGKRTYRIHYSLIVNGERHEKNIDIKGQNEELAESKLTKMIGLDAELEIHSTTPVK
jgi:hypothetical protein